VHIVKIKPVGVCRELRSTLSWVPATKEKDGCQVDAASYCPPATHARKSAKARIASSLIADASPSNAERSADIHSDARSTSTPFKGT